MLCQNCQKKLPAGKVLCPDCGCLNPYNINGYANTKAVQTSLKTMIGEHSGRIADAAQFKAVLRDFIPDLDAERRLIAKAVDAGLLDMLMTAEKSRTMFKELRETLIKDGGFGKYDAEFVLVCFAHMLSFNYVSPMFEDDEPPEEEKEKKVSAPAAPVIKPKPFGKLDAFRYALSGRVAVKDGFTELSAYCFENYGLMKEITLPESVSLIGEYAFSDCKNLQSIEIPKAVRKMDKGVFNACLGLKKVTLPEGIMTIGDNCFFCCASLKVLRIPDTVSSIGENAFSGCAGLEKLIISRNVKFIDKNAFAYCGKLTVICTENSFVHKYCIQNKIKYNALPLGMNLPGGDEVEDELDE